MKTASACASTSELIVKYSPRKRKIGTETASANSAEATPPARIDGSTPSPADSDSFAVPYDPTPVNAATASDTMPP